MQRRSALVKSENYIRPQIFLYLYGNVRVKFVFFSVISKNYPFRVNLDLILCPTCHVQPATLNIADWRFCRFCEPCPSRG